MEIEYDPQKADEVWQKHRVHLSDCEMIFYDDHAICVEDGHHEGERRWVRIGMNAQGQLVLVWNTWRGDTARLITARKASKSERTKYEERN
ncbi:MAG: BrnT family toxin [Polaromonas sp.]|uniref:BrnT family toxin n=1 Tax=Polaromonas sp. TaxID=1869339 RepID=UPI0040366A89